MKNTIKYILGLCCLMLWSCNEENRPFYDADELGQFVHFAMIIDKDDKPVTDKIIPNREYATSYEHKSYSPLTIPVALTATSIDANFTVTYIAETYGDYDNASFTPENTLSFGPDKMLDSIYISFDGKWDTAVVDSIVLTLSSTTGKDISIGNPFGFEKNDKLSIVLGDLNFPMTVSTPNNFELSGDKDQEFKFFVKMPNGIVAADYADLQFFKELSADFDYTLTPSPFKDGDTEIEFTLKVNEALDNPKRYYECKLELIPKEGYNTFAYTTVSFKKLPLNPANNNINMARHFYDNAYDFYNRTYYWLYMDKLSQDICKWWRSSAFTYPVEVDQSHPNAVLHEDGKYYHAFQIGFHSTNPERTINGLSLKSWFDNYYSDADVSPGFNVHKAIEFFPKDGTSYTEGTVSIVNQELVIASKSRTQYTLEIAGEGTYHYVENSQETYNDSIFEINMVFEVTSEELFGGTRKMSYQMLNRKPETEEKPTYEGISCYKQYYLK